MEFRHFGCAAFGTILLSITACDQQPKTPATHPAAAVVAKQPHPDCSRESLKYSPTAATHVSEAKVLASDNATITLFLDTNHFPLDVKGWQIRRLPVADMLAKGDIHEWAGDRYAYGLADVQIGDIVEVGLLKDEADKRVYIYEIRIEERPGGLVPPSRRPGQTIHCPPNQVHSWKHGPYHVWINAQNDLKAGRPVPEDVLRLIGKLPPLPQPDAVPDQLPRAKQ